MNTVKVRRVGNSNVVSLPRGLEQHGFAEGQSVALVPLRNGQILLVAEAHLEEFIAEMGRHVIEQNREALDKLAAFDQGNIQVATK